MNIALWVIQGFLAIAFLGAGFMKVTRSKDQLKETDERMAWVEDFSDTQLRGIGVLEVLGALGLFLPGVTGILTFLTPLAAVGLVLTMIGAMMTHIRRKEPVLGNVVLLVLALLVVYGRLVAAPLSA